MEIASFPHPLCHFHLYTSLKVSFAGAGTERVDTSSEQQVQMKEEQCWGLLVTNWIPARSEGIYTWLVVGEILCECCYLASEKYYLAAMYRLVSVYSCLV